MPEGKDSLQGEFLFSVPELHRNDKFYFHKSVVILIQLLFWIFGILRTPINLIHNLSTFFIHWLFLYKLDHMKCTE